MNTAAQRLGGISLRNAFLLDATATGTLGMGLILAADAVDVFLGLPAMLLRTGGLMCVAFAAFLVYAVTRGNIPAWMARVAIGVNSWWVVMSFGVLVMDSVAPTLPGAVLVSAQALVVLGFIGLQYLAARRASGR